MDTRNATGYNQTVSHESVLPGYAKFIFLCFVTTSFIFCIISLVAIGRTKKTPYSTKTLSLGLLSFNSLFLISSCVAKFFSYKEVYIVQHITRGFHVTSSLIVGGMVLDRLLVIRWPYFYLKYATEDRIRKICAGLSVIGFLQYVIVRGILCYVPMRPLNCGVGLQVYLTMLTAIPLFSTAISGKIYWIIRGKSRKQPANFRQQYRGTAVCLIFVVNDIFNTIVSLSFSVIYIKSITDNEVLATIADGWNVVTCIMNAIVYVLWFKETRLEVLKMVQNICPQLKPKIQLMQYEIFCIVTSTGSGAK